MGNDNEQGRNNDLYCTETIFNTAESAAWKADITSKRRARRKNKTYAQSQLCTGTTEDNPFRFPNPGSEEWKRKVYKPDKHLFSDYPERINKRGTGISYTELQDTLYLDLDKNTRNNTNDVQYENDQRDNKLYNNTPNGPIYVQGDECEERSTNKIQNDGNITPHMSTKQQNRPNKSENERKRKPTEEKGNTSKKPRKQQLVEKTESNKPTAPTTTRTTTTTTTAKPQSTRRELNCCVLTKSNSRGMELGRGEPTFISFDHGSHWHIAFYSDKSGGNRNRTRERIAKFYNATTGGITEIFQTTQKIKCTRAYILYCIRNGIRTVRMHGNKISWEYTELNDEFNKIKEIDEKNNTQEGDPTGLTCKKYIEAKKDEVNLSKKMAMEKRNEFAISFIMLVVFISCIVSVLKISITCSTYEFTDNPCSFIN